MPHISVTIASAFYIILSIIIGINFVRVSRYNNEGTLGQTISFLVGFLHPAFVAYYAVKTLAILIWTPRPWIESAVRHEGQPALTVVFNENYTEIEKQLDRQQRRNKMRYTGRR